MRVVKNVKAVPIVVDVWFAKIATNVSIALV